MWPASFTPIVFGYLVVERAHANADVVLPCEAGLARYPSFTRVVVLFGGAAHAADYFGFFVFVLFFLFQGLFRLFRLSALGDGGGGGLFEFVEGFRVLALGRPDRASRFCFS